MNLNNYGKVLSDVSLKNYNTYRVDSKVKNLLIIDNVDNLVKFFNDYQGKFLIIGNGSNVIFKNDYYDYPFIKLELNEIKLLGDNRVYVESGVMPGRLINELYQYNLGGLEWASGIPGTIGGIIYNNAGAYNEEISAFIEDVTCFDLNTKEIVKLSARDSNFKYRSSLYKDNKNLIIIGVTLILKDVDVNSSKELIADRLSRRKASQPLEYPSAGSVFRNPEGEFAGHLIEINNFKGYHINDAYVSEKHANFIINMGNASGSDIVKLINEIKEKVKKENNIDLILEQEIIE